MEMKNKISLILLSIFFISFFYRLTFNNNSFWIDEFSTAEQAKLVLKHGMGVFNQTTNYFEAHNVSTHFIIAGSFLTFGFGEWQTRLPMMLIGSLVPVVIYLFAKSAFNNRTALISSATYIFSYWQITWARQARGYVLQQLITLLTLYLYHSILNKFTKIRAASLLFLIILGLLTHTTFALIVISIAVHFFITKGIKKIDRKLFLFFIPALISLALIATLTGQFNSIIESLKITAQDIPNNLPYYHSFLWREQTIITLLAAIGLLFLVLKERKYSLTLLLVSPVALYTFFVCFLFAPYVSRYLLPIFPLLIILAGTAISKISEAIWNKQSMYLGLAIAFFIIANGDKFVLKPKAYYSVNHDMREIALINYHKVYDLIKQKGNIEKGETAIIDTWPDRLKWYMGENKEYFYAFRWLKSEGLVNGLPKRTNFELNSANEKVIPKTGLPAIKLIGELSDLEKAMTKYQYGFIWIDDASLPKDVIDYAKQNFKEELYLDHYPLDDNPYSIWPGTLYSWGFESPNPFFKSL